MSMTVVATRNVSDRIRGFLASSMLELMAGVYIAPRLSPVVRDRLWTVLADWFWAEQNASILMLWADSRQPGGLAMRSLGLPPLELIEVDGLILTKR
jgi:CRISPR-associated protein Cas2